MIPKTPVETNILSLLAHLHSPPPLLSAAPSHPDRVFLRCPPNFHKWCNSTLLPRRPFLHSCPVPGYHTSAGWQEDAPGRDRFVLQIIRWVRDGANDIYEMDLDGWGAVHFPSWFLHGLMWVYQRRKWLILQPRAYTDQSAAREVLKQRGVPFLGLPTS